MTDTICPSCGLGQHEPGLCLECLGCTECVIDVDTSRCLVCGELDSSAEYERVCELLTRALGEPITTIQGDPLWRESDGDPFVLMFRAPEALYIGEHYACSRYPVGEFLPLDGSAKTDAAIQQVIMRFKRREK